jgi:hypothetical protein
MAGVMTFMVILPLKNAQEWKRMHAHICACVRAHTQGHTHAYTLSPKEGEREYGRMETLPVKGFRVVGSLCTVSAYLQTRTSTCAEGIQSQKKQQWLMHECGCAYVSSSSGHTANSTHC